MEDRFTRGFIAGIIAGIAMNVPNYISFYLLDYAKLRFLDYASIALFGHRPLNFTEIVVAQISQIFFAGFLGIIFAYLITGITSRNHLLKGWVFSLFIWFITFAIAIVFRMPDISKPATESVISNSVGATVYGLCLPAILGLLDNKFKRPK